MSDTPKKRGRPKGSKDLTPRKKRTDIAARFTEGLEPGDNSRFLAHALAIRDMPPIDIADPEQVRERIDWYFHHCFDNDMKPTVTGFCNSLKIGRTTLWEWKNSIYRADSHQAIILEAYRVLETLWEEYMQNGKINPVSGIFLGKNNFGYMDKQEHVITPNTGEIQPTDKAAIEAKYAELPED